MIPPAPSSARLQPPPARRPARQVAHNPCGCVYRAELGKEYTITTMTAIICGDQVKDNSGKFLACSNDTFANPTGEPAGPRGQMAPGAWPLVQAASGLAAASFQFEARPAISARRPHFRTFHTHLSAPPTPRRVQDA